MDSGASTSSDSKPTPVLEKPNKSPVTTDHQASDTQHLQEQDIKSLKGSNDSKDKTQLAATTSMAVIHVGILKALLDLGPNGLSYYDWCLSFVITALALQFISGIIAIYIATMKSFLAQFKYDITYYCKRNCCPCIFESRSRVDVAYLAGGDGSNPGGSGNETIELVEHHESSQPRCCCTCGQKDKSADALEYEDILLDSYFDWQNQNFHMQLDTANIDQNIAFLEESLAHLRETRESTFKEVTDPNDPRLADIDLRIAKQEQHLQHLTKKKHESQSLQQKGKVLTTQLKYVLNQKVMKKAAFWQCILTILTYVIFALNTIITGFGLSNLAKA